MSSVVNLRSYERRRKSAGARLEGTYSQTAIPSIAALPHPNTVSVPTKDIPIITRFREKRVKSAIETRKEQEASDIFPELEKGKLNLEWWKTKYSEDFCPKKITSPVHVRPVSPTRMNNPHPSKEFLVWKHPVRIHKHKKATNPPPDIWQYIQERFYEDYLDTYNTGDAKNEVPITNLAKIKFPRKKEDHEAPLVIRGISGKKAQLNPRHPLQDNNNQESEKIFRPPSPQSLMLHHTLKGNILPKFKEWLKSATVRERETLLQMLQAAHDDSEEKRLSRVVSDVLQPESANHVQEWLKNANDSERQIVLHVLETLAVATGEGDVYAMTYPAFYPHIQHRHHHTLPLSLRGNTHSHSHSCQHRHGHKCSRHRHSSHHSSSRHSSSKNSIKSGSDFDSSSGMGLVGKKIVKPGKEYHKTPEPWQNRILVKKLGTELIHPAGVFHQPNKATGQHYVIHPEWPTA